MSTSTEIPNMTRRYIRIPSILPVTYQFLNTALEPLDLEIRTGFTRDLSEGGMCLKIYSLSEELRAQLKDQSTELGITIDMNLKSRILRLPGQVVWRKFEIGTGNNEILNVGIQFIGLSGESAKTIVAFARRAARRPKISRLALLGLVILLLAGLGWYGWQQHQHQIAFQRSKTEVQMAQKKYRQLSERVGDMHLELRWVAMQIEEIVESLQHNQIQPVEAQQQRMGPVLDDLSQNIEKLKTLVMANSQLNPKLKEP